MELQNLESSSLEETERIRTLKELYQLVLDNFDKSDILAQGICIKITELCSNSMISDSEYYFLIKNLDKNKPKWYNSKFWWNLNYIESPGWWWKLTEEGNEQRKLFLQHLIKKYS